MILNGTSTHKVIIEFFFLSHLIPDFHTDDDAWSSVCLSVRWFLIGGGGKRGVLITKDL